MNDTPLIPLYFKANFLFTTLLYLLFLTYNPYEGALPLLFGIAAALSTAATLYLIYYIVLRPFAYFRRSILGLSTLLFLATNIALVVDFFIFRIWKFHINAMVLNILFSPAAFDSIQTGVMPVLTAVAVTAGVLFAEYRLVKKIAAAPSEKMRALNRRFNTLVFPLLFAVIFTEKVAYGFANIFAHRPLLESTKPIPLYQPMDFTKTAEKVLNIKAVKPDAHSFAIAADKELRYPTEALTYEANASTPHIFWIVIDSARYDMLTPNVMPNAEALAQQSWNFTQNISGGNTTRFGIFSLLYGINSSYWFSFLNAQKGSLLFDVLQKRGYAIKIVSSTDTSWPEFQKTAFFDVTDKIEDSWEGKPHEKDRQSSAAFMRWIEKADASHPLFGFLFLDAPHGPTYPEDSRRFLPDDYGELNYLTVTEADRKPMLNQYKNAIVYDDRLLGEILDAVNAKGIDGESLIIVTADHGQEYYEYGLFGHNSAYNHAQVRVPLLMRWPSKEARTLTHLTSSLDIVPTLLRRLGVTTPPSAYSNGYDLADPGYKRPYAFIGNWNDNAIVTEKETYVFSNMPGSILSNEIRNTANYTRMESRDPAAMQRTLLDALNENSKFIGR